MTTIEATETSRVTTGPFNRRLEGIGWALFLILIGGLLLLPEGMVPEGTWLAGAGLIMIGMNIVRHFHGVRISSFTAVLGLVALAIGIGAIVGIDLPVFAILLAAIGAEILYSATRRQ